MQTALMGLQFGVFDHIEHLDGVPLEQLYRERLEQIEALDRAGFYAYHLAEHHSPSLHSMAPAQNVFLGAAAQRSGRLHLGGCVYTLPFHHPIRLIEELSMLDQMSGGRLEIGVGRGGELEAYYWGLGDQPEIEALKDEVRGRYEESLEVLIDGFTHDRINYHGRYYRFHEMPMRLRPLQKPYPPLWYMRNVETAARHGMNALLVGGLERLGTDVARFWKLWDEHQATRLTAQGTEPKVGSVVYVVVADTDEEAASRAGPAWEQFVWNLRVPRRQEAEAHGLGSLVATGAAGFGSGTRTGFADAAAEDAQRGPRTGRVGGTIAGSPETICKFLDEYLQTGANYIVFALQFGSITHAEAMRSIDLLARDVLPKFASEARLTAG
jgi:alkanesulfonate monooxygenase SsuD/methylene tetrahydromethanopterin reductase-like flavin-dependent oxidoreductase (luciferase family)